MEHNNLFNLVAKAEQFTPTAKEVATADEQMKFAMGMIGRASTDSNLIEPKDQPVHRPAMPIPN